MQALRRDLDSGANFNANALAQARAVQKNDDKNLAIGIAFVVGVIFLAWLVA